MKTQTLYAFFYSFCTGMVVGSLLVIFLNREAGLTTPSKMTNDSSRRTAINDQGDGKAFTPNQWLIALKAAGCKYLDLWQQMAAIESGLNSELCMAANNPVSLRPPSGWVSTRIGMWHGYCFYESLIDCARDLRRREIFNPMNPMESVRAYLQRTHWNDAVNGYYERFK